MNTKPPTTENVRSVWTPKDEAALRELQERRRRIMAENEMRVADALSFLNITPAEVEDVIKAAAVIRDALKPFDSRTFD